MRSVILVAENFRMKGVRIPLQVAGISDVEVASADGKDRYGKYGVPARVTLSFSEIKGDEFDLVLIPGGFSAQTGCE